MVLWDIVWEGGLAEILHKRSFGRDINILKLNCGDGCVTLYIY